MNKMNNVSGNKRLLINILANGFSFIGTFLISFILTPYLINSLGKEAYSFYPIANSFVSYMSIITNALNAVANRFISFEVINGNKKQANVAFSSAFFSNVIMSGILLIPMLVIVCFIDRFMNVPFNLLASVRMLFAFTFASMLVNVATSVFGVTTFVTNRVDLRSICELLIAVIRSLLFLLFFAFLRPSIVYIGIIAFIVAMINMCFQCLLKRRLLPDLKINKSLFSSIFVKGMLSSGSWNIINQLGNMMLANSTLILANMLYGASVGGDYSIIQTFPHLFNGIITMLVSVFMPTIMRCYAEKRINDVTREIDKAQRLMGTLCNAVMAVIIGMSFEFFSLWVPEQNARYLATISTIAILPQLIISPVWPISNLNVIMDKLKLPACYLLASGLLNILGAIVCSYTIPGKLMPLVAVCSILQLIWAFIFIPIYPCKYLSVPKKQFYPVVIRSFLGTVLGVIITLLVKQLFDISTWFSWFAVGIGIGIVVLILQALIVFGFKQSRQIWSHLMTQVKERTRKITKG